jgi:hypothetical protein
LRRAQAELAGGIFGLANVFVKSRAISIKTLAAGLAILFFNVTIPSGQGSIGSLVGSALIE